MTTTKPAMTDTAKILAQLAANGTMSIDRLQYVCKMRGSANRMTMAAHALVTSGRARYTTTESGSPALAPA